MKNGFIKVAAATPDLRVADCSYNANEIISITNELAKKGVSLIVFPELSITGYTCGDLFLTKTLPQKALDALELILDKTSGSDAVTVVGLPYLFGGKLYNCAALLPGGKILGIVPKTYIPCHNGSNEKRQFCSGSQIPEGSYIEIDGAKIPFGTDILFSHSSIEEYKIGLEICV